MSYTCGRTIITDLDWYTPFSKYRDELDEYGLFDSYLFTSMEIKRGILHGSMEDSSHQPWMEQIPSQTPMMWTASARPRPSTAWDINT